MEYGFLGVGTEGGCGVGEYTESEDKRNGKSTAKRGKRPTANGRELTRIKIKCVRAPSAREGSGLLQTDRPCHLNKAATPPALCVHTHSRLFAVDASRWIQQVCVKSAFICGLV